jgi:hypothetical protein
MFNMDNTIKFFLVCDDGAAACVGPFNTIDEIESHRLFLEDRGDADSVGRVISVESMSDLDAELSALGYPEGVDLYMTPDEDRADGEPCGSDYDGDNMTDVEADADTLASAGYGTDEDYGYFGGDDY